MRVVPPARSVIWAGAYLHEGFSSAVAVCSYLNKPPMKEGAYNLYLPKVARTRSITYFGREISQPWDNLFDHIRENLNGGF